jgi:hypothetical protein
LNTSPHLAKALLLALIVCFIAVQARSLDNGFVGDDWEHLYVASTTSPSLTGVLKTLDLSTPRHYRPVHWMCTLLLYNAFGLTPAPFHVLSILLDLANAFLVGFLVLRLQRSLGSRRAHMGRLAALAVGLLFWLSPRNHEAVFWYAAINEVLALLFCLVALHCALSWLRGEKRSQAAYLGAMAAALLALGSKESAVVLPAEMALLFAYELIASGMARRSALQRAVAGILPFAILAALWMVAYLLSVPAPIAGPVPRAMTNLIRADAGIWVLRLVQHLNGTWIPVGWLSRHMWLLIMELGVLVAVVAFAMTRRRWLWLLGLAIMVISVMPYVAIQYGVTPPDQQALLLTLGGDRYQYSAAVGGAIVLIESVLWLVEDVLRRLPQRVFSVALAAVVAGLLSCAIGEIAVRAFREAEWDTSGHIVARALEDVRAAVPSVGSSALFCIDQLPVTYGNIWAFGSAVRYALYVMYGRSDMTVRISYYPAPWDGPSPTLKTGGCPLVLKVNPRTGAVTAH